MATGLEIKQKRSFRPLKWVLRLIVLVLIITIGYYGLMWYQTGKLPVDLPIAAANPGVNETPVTTEQRRSYAVTSEQPRTLTISKLGIKNARISPIELNKNRQFDLPKYLDDAGWYKKSATPGQDFGAIVLDGHSKGPTRDGVFARLEALKSKDTISIERGDGKAFTYEVYDIHEMPTVDALRGGIAQAMYPVDDTKEGLSIIAPSGRWVPKDSDFSHRTILRAIRK